MPGPGDLDELAAGSGNNRPLSGREVDYGLPGLPAIRHGAGGWREVRRKRKCLRLEAAG